MSQNNKSFSLLGANCNGLRGKWDSLISNIQFFQSSIVTLQEIKQSKAGNFKLDGFQIFERVRDSNGGGLMTISDVKLDPILVHVGSDNNEILTIEVNIEGNNVRIVNGYGPQEDSSDSLLLSFWQEMEQEIVKASNDSCNLLIQ